MSQCHPAARRPPPMVFATASSVRVVPSPSRQHGVAHARGSVLATKGNSNTSERQCLADEKQQQHTRKSVFESQCSSPAAKLPGRDVHAEEQGAWVFAAVGEALRARGR